MGVSLSKNCFKFNNKNAIYLFDLVHDKVKIRWILPLGIVFIIFILISSIFAITYLIQTIPSFLKVIIPPPTSLELGNKANLFIIGVSNQNYQPMNGINITAKIEDLIVKTNNEVINCDSKYMQQNFWTYEYIRNLGACQIIIEGNIAMTDVGGYAHFNNFSFEKAPQGSYYIFFEIENTLILSSIHNILLAPSIMSMRVLNNPPRNTEINIRLNPQPSLIIYDKFGDPLFNESVVAFSWPFADYKLPFPQLYDPEADKFAVFDGINSNLSNNEGITNFVNLTILGSTHTNVYILFISIGNEVIAPWKSDKYPNLVGGYIRLPVFIPGIQLIYKQSLSISFIEEFSNESIEGVSFPSQPLLKISDYENNKPIIGIICFALLKVFNNYYFPAGFQPHFNRAAPKSILYGISANYPSHTINKYNTNINFSISDINGYNEFQKVALSREGTNYQKFSQAGIIIRCGNAISDIKYLWLITSVTYINIILPPVFVERSNYRFFDISDKGYYMVSVHDEHGFPLSKKCVNNFIVTNAISTLNDKVLIGHYLDLNNTIIGYSINSDIFGIINSYVKILEFNSNNGSFNINISIDGIFPQNISSFKIAFIDSPKDCKRLELFNTSKIFNVIDIETINILTVFKDYLNTNYSNSSYLSSSFFSLKSTDLIYTSLDKDSLEFGYSMIASSVDKVQENEYILNYSIGFLSLFSGTYIEFGIFSDNSTFLDTCLLDDPIIFNYTNTINNVVFVSPSLSLFEGIELEQKDLSTPLILQILDKTGKPISNLSVNLSIIIYEYPSFILYSRYDYLFEYYDFDKKSYLQNSNKFPFCEWNYYEYSNSYFCYIQEPDNYFTITFEDNITFSDKNGLIYFNLSVNSRFLGDYFISILVNGISTIPFKVKVISAVQTITLTQFPDNSSSFLILQKVFPSFVLQIKSSDNLLSDIPIVAQFQSNDNSVYIDMVDSKDRHKVMNIHRINFTNLSGFATFTDLRLLSFDNSNMNNCIEGSFYFIVGLNDSILTNLTPKYNFCFKNTYLLGFNTHDKEIYLNSEFYDKLIFIMYDSDLIKSMESYHPIIFQVRIVNYEGKLINSPKSETLASSLISHKNCISVFDISFNYTCNVYYYDKTEINNEFFEIYIIELTNLKWNFLSETKKFDLIPCIYNLCNYSSTELLEFRLSKPKGEIHFNADLPSSLFIGDQQMINVYFDSNFCYENIHCNILSKNYFLLNTEIMLSIVNLLSRQLDEPDLFNYLSKSSRIQINKSYSNIVTDFNGISNILFSFISGKPGYYMILCQSSNNFKILSNVFFINNSISNITIINDQEYILEYQFKKANGRILAHNISIPKSINLSIKFISSEFIEDLVNFITIEIFNENMHDFTGANINTDDSLSFQLISLWNILTQGTLSLFSERSQITINYFYDLLEWNKENKLYLFSNLKVEFPSPGTYWMKFVCKGIESNFSKPIFINPLNYENIFGFCLYYCNYFYIFSTIFVLLINSNPFTLIFIFISALFLMMNFIMHIFNSLDNIFTLTLGILVLMFLLILLCRQIIYFFMQGNDSFFLFTKLKYYAIYSHSKIKGLLRNICKNPMKFDLKDDFFISMSRLIVDENNKKNVMSSNDSFHRDKNINIPKKRTLFLFIFKICAIFHEFNPISCFYFPQRIISAVIVSIFTLIYCVFIITNYAFDIINAVITLQIAISNNIFSFVKNLFSIIASKMNYELKDSDIQIYYSTIDQFIAILTDFQNSIKIALIVANCIISLIFIFSIFNLMVKFQGIVIKSRKSANTMKKYMKYNITSASDLIGIMMGSTAISYIIVTSIMTLIFGILVNKYFWHLLWEFKVFLSILVLPNIIQYIIDFFMYMIIYDDNLTIKSPIILQAYDIYCLAASIFQGIASSCSRLIFGLLAFFVGLIRFDKSIIQKWMQIPFLTDSVDESLRASLVMHILYTNPLFLYASNTLISRHNISTRTSCKLWLFFILAKTKNYKFLRHKMTNAKEKPPITVNIINNKQIKT